MAPWIPAKSAISGAAGGMDCLGFLGFLPPWIGAKRSRSSPLRVGPLRPLPPPLASKQPFPADMARPVGFAIRLSPQELALFHAVARARETTLAELIRAAVAAEAVAAGVEMPAVIPTA